MITQQSFSLARCARANVQVCGRVERIYSLMFQFQRLFEGRLLPPAALPAPYDWIIFVEAMIGRRFPLEYGSDGGLQSLAHSQPV
jgi:hypothetical protein